MRIKLLPAIGLLLIGIMLFSLIASVVLSAFTTKPLPKNNITDYELDSYTEYTLLTQGKVLMKLFYEKGCQNCGDKISMLEGMTKSYPDQTFLEEILSNQTIPLLHFVGFNIKQNSIYLDERELKGENITEEKVMNILCNIMIKPPTMECVKL